MIEKSANEVRARIKDACRQVLMDIREMEFDPLACYEITIRVKPDTATEISIPIIDICIEKDCTETLMRWRESPPYR